MAITVSTVRFKFNVNKKRIIASGHLRKNNRKEKLIKSCVKVRSYMVDNLTLIFFAYAHLFLDTLAFFFSVYIPYLIYYDILFLK